MDAHLEGHAAPTSLQPVVGHKSDVARLSFQSIARAREEGRRLLAVAAADGAAAATGEGDEHGEAAAAAARGLRRGGARHRKGSVASAATEASESRRKWAEQRGAVPGGAANFYKEVAVTPKDMQVVCAAFVSCPQLGVFASLCSHPLGVCLFVFVATFAGVRAAGPGAAPSRVTGSASARQRGPRDALGPPPAPGVAGRQRRL